MEYDEIIEHIEDVWARSIEKRLVKLDDFAFKNYITTLNTYYDNKNYEYIVSCSVDVIRTYYSDIKIPRQYIESNNPDKIEETIIKIAADLSRQITDKNYIEINGIKYYPKTDGETND